MLSRMKKITSALVCMTMLMMLMVAQPTSVAFADSSQKITILGTSDIHGRYMPWDYAMDAANLGGSLTQISTVVKSIRKDNPNTILVDAGDLIQDNAAELFNNAEQHPAMVALNEMGYDVWNTGNHEFNFGLGVLDKIAKQFKGKILGGNIYQADGTRYLPAYTIIEKGGVKIGIIGINTPLVAQFEAGTDHIKGITFNQPIEETKKAIAELKGKVDAIVGIMHMGKDNENNISGTGVKDIANACPELTAIIAGHMHAVIKSELINGVLVTEPGKYGAGLSKLELSFNLVDGKYQLANKTSDVMAINSAIASDISLEKAIEAFHNTAREDANTVIGELKGVDMVPANEIADIPQVQIQETPLTDFFNEVQLYYSKADVVAISIDNDKAKLSVGPIKKKDISYNYQYALGESTVYEVTGKDVKDYMEWAAAYFNTAVPGDATVSFNSTRRASKYSTNDIFGGVKYEIDLSKPVGSRITNLRRLDGTPIKLEETLKLATNDYRMQQLKAKGGPLEGRTYKVLWSSKDTSVFGEDQGTIRNMAIRYIKEVMKGTLTTTVKDNWKIIGVNSNVYTREAIGALVDSGTIKIKKTTAGFTNIESINISEGTLLNLEVKIKLLEKFIKILGDFSSIHK